MVAVGFLLVQVKVAWSKSKKNGASLFRYIRGGVCGIKPVLVGIRRLDPGAELYAPVFLYKERQSLIIYRESKVVKNSE
jgi:hypothetical protein